MFEILYSRSSTQYMASYYYSLELVLTDSESEFRSPITTSQVLTVRTHRSVRAKAARHRPRTVAQVRKSAGQSQSSHHTKETHTRFGPYPLVFPLVSVLENVSSHQSTHRSKLRHPPGSDPSLSHRLPAADDRIFNLVQLARSRQRSMRNVHCVPYGCVRTLEGDGMGAYRQILVPASLRR